jgi:hypothetical protein
MLAFPGGRYRFPENYSKIYSKCTSVDVVVMSTPVNHQSTIKIIALKFFGCTLLLNNVD